MCITRRCRVNRCKDRCSSWFPNDVQLREGCKAACKEDHSLTRREQYLCGGYIDEQAYILARGIDPCPGNDITAQSILDPWQTAASNANQGGQKQAAEARDQANLVIYGLAGLAALLLITFLIRSS